MWTLYEGDCFDYLPLIEDQSVDMILCDLPYGTTACKWDTPLPLKELWEQYERVIKLNGAIVLTGSQPFTSALVMSNPHLFKYAFTWIKTKASGFQNAKKMPMKKHEDILVFYKKLPTYNQQNLVKLEKPVKSGRVREKNEHKLGVAGKPDYYTTYTGYQDSILKFSNPSGNGHLHPTQKPVALFEYLIKTYTNEEDLVLDNCAGSGTTGVACENLNRHSILMEKEPEYCQIIRNRLNELNVQTKLKVEA